jgi:hypothetical protein
MYWLLVVKVLKLVKVVEVGWGWLNLSVSGTMCGFIKHSFKIQYPTFNIFTYFPVLLLYKKIV